VLRFGIMNTIPPCTRQCSDTEAAIDSMYVRVFFVQVQICMNNQWTTPLRERKV